MDAEECPPQERGGIRMKPIQWLGLIFALLCLAMLCGWYFYTPPCPNVPGFKDQHPGVSCR